MKKKSIVTILTLFLIFNSITVLADSGVRIYQSENGPVKVPSNPQRVVVLSTFAGNVLALGVNIVGADSWAKNNSNYDLAGVSTVSDHNLEQILALNPDLIIGLSNLKNINRLKKIAPTVTFTYGRLGYLEQHLEIAKLLNKEKTAKEWIADFKARTKKIGKAIKDKIGSDATVTVIETSAKELYVFGKNWGRGTEILYQEMNLKMPQSVKELVSENGYQTLSFEVLPEIVGDYLIISQTSGSEIAFQKTATYQNIPAVKQEKVFTAPADKFYFNDPITLEYQLQFIKNNFLSN
ncbi:iron-hydroxamate ABC transporter substrate-binding protein [Halanaerobium salsuginis]|jgi:iron complex transport system substrate-binding protein|uniref:Iron complex transport system substrate-binding protein n=1 Tax=Halanaerobium salsuginis TaxID=29563 RepID=A0A1I4KNZ6_9FIRM|nr:iron-hydroxamate ABC transporter substrate-binding protein [Halanaerobium salsuginis]SFL80502.1 iron complex transport system substrate-binding protein [Halanaerobium salsuginis]